MMQTDWVLSLRLTSPCVNKTDGGKWINRVPLINYLNISKSVLTHI